MLRRYSVLLSLALTLGFSDPVAASPQSDELVRQGVAELKKQNFDEALGRFQAANTADPKDPEAAFFMGVALNRLGRHQAALFVLERAKEIGSTNPELGFETGWALVAVGRFKEAAAQLEAFEKARPGRGQTSEFLGRAYFGLGELDKAEAKLKEAMERDPKLKPTVLFYLAAVEAGRKNLEAARKNLQALLQEAPESPLGRMLREELARVARAAAIREKPWSVTFALGGGYNSNVIALGDNSPLPQGVTRKNTGFGRFTLGGTYSWLLGREDTLTGGYAFLADLYNQVSSSDTRDHFAYGDYRHVFSRELVGALRVSNEFTQIARTNFRNQFAVRPTLGYRFADWGVTELTYAATTSNYYFNAPKVQDRDGVTHTLGLNNFFTIPGTQLSARLGYFHVWNLADGNDFDFQTNGLQVGLAHPLPWQITGEIAYTRTWDRFEHKNSLAGVGFDFARKDDVDAATLQLVRPISEMLRLYTRYDFTRDHSNISFFAFKQHVVSAGVVVNF